MATQYSILNWRSMDREPSRLYGHGVAKVRHNWTDRRNTENRSSTGLVINRFQRLETKELHNLLRFTVWLAARILKKSENTKLYSWTQRNINGIEDTDMNSSVHAWRAGIGGWFPEEVKLTDRRECVSWTKKSICDWGRDYPLLFHFLTLIENINFCFFVFLCLRWARVSYFLQCFFPKLINVRQRRRPTEVLLRIESSDDKRTKKRPNKKTRVSKIAQIKSWV